MEIGIDIEQSSRFKKLSKKVAERVYTEAELEYARRFVLSYEHLCSMWCAKEATVKAIGDGKISYKDIEIYHDSHGKPYVKINKALENELKRHGAREIKISISHSKNYATAVCLII